MRILHGVRLIMGAVLFLGGIYYMVNNELVPSPLFYLLVVLVGMLYLLMSTISLAPTSDMKLPPPTAKNADILEFGFRMDTLEGGKAGVESLSKLLKRAEQIKKCKRNTDFEAFEQATTEARELGEMEQRE